MLSSKTLRLAGLALVSGLFVPAAFTVACSSDNASNPVPTVPTYAVDATTSPPDSSGPQGDDGPSTGDDATDAADAHVLIPEDAQACTLARLPATGAPASDAGCWNAADPNCRAQTNPEFLNQCAGTGVTCARFDNARLPGYDGGALPPFN